MKRLPLACGLVLILLSAYLGAENPPAVAPVSSPATAFFQSPDFFSPAVSPDGKNVAFIARHNGHSRLFKLELATGKVAGVFDPGDGEVDRAWWLGSRRLLIAGEGEFGYKYFVQELDGGKPRVVSTLEYVPPERITALPNDAEHVIAVKFLREWYVTRVDVRADRGQQLDGNVFDPSGGVLSAQGEVRAKAYQYGETWRLFWRSSATSPWHDLEGHGAQPTFWPLAVAQNDHDLIVISYDQGNTSALMTLDPDTGKRTLLAQRPDRDVFRLIRKEPDHFPVCVSFFNPGHDDLVFFDDSAGKFYASLAQALPEIHKRVAGSSADSGVQIIEAWDPGAPSRYYLLEKARGRLSKLGQQYADDSLPPLGTVRFFEFATRDGVHESGYILLPHPSRAARPCPLLIVPMAYVGQEGGLAYGFDGMEQYLASRGIAVARLLVRGSRGLGKTFQMAGDFKLADVVAHDYEDGLKYLTQEGLVDADRVAIIGWERSALFALRMASVSTAFKAVVAHDPVAYELSNQNIDWLTGSGGAIASMIQQAGGSQTAYNLVHEFEPEHFMSNLSAHALIIYTSSFDREFLSVDAGMVRDSLRRHGKPYEWYLFDVHDIEHRPEWYYLAVFNTKIADYLTRTLNVTLPGAAVTR
jgi:dienelactone hydrolase